MVANKLALTPTIALAKLVPGLPYQFVL